MKKLCLFLMLIISLSVSGQTTGGHAIKWYWWGKPSIVLIDISWYEKAFNWLVNNLEASHCSRMNFMWHQVDSKIPPTCNHRINHVAKMKGGVWTPKK
jgi:hypothetical protein